MKLVVRHGEGELVVGSQKEFLVLYQRGFVGPDDLVRREGAGPEVKWVRADELSWIKGSALDTKKDSQRLFGITLVMMILGLVGVIYIQARASKLSHKKPWDKPAASAPADANGPGAK